MGGWVGLGRAGSRATRRARLWRRPQAAGGRAAGGRAVDIKRRQCACAASFCASPQSPGRRWRPPGRCPCAQPVPPGLAERPARRRCLPPWRCVLLNNPRIGCSAAGASAPLQPPLLAHSVCLHSARPSCSCAHATCVGESKSIHAAAHSTRNLGIFSGPSHLPRRRSWAPTPVPQSVIRSPRPSLRAYP